MLCFKSILILLATIILMDEHRKDEREAGRDKKRSNSKSKAKSKSEQDNKDSKERRSDSSSKQKRQTSTDSEEESTLIEEEKRSKRKRPRRRSKRGSRKGQRIAEDTAKTSTVQPDDYCTDSDKEQPRLKQTPHKKKNSSNSKSPSRKKKLLSRRERNARRTRTGQNNAGEFKKKCELLRKTCAESPQSPLNCEEDERKTVHCPPHEAGQSADATRPKETENREVNKASKDERVGSISSSLSDEQSVLSILTCWSESKETIEEVLLERAKAKPGSAPSEEDTNVPDKSEIRETNSENRKQE